MWGGITRSRPRTRKHIPSDGFAPTQDDRAALVPQMGLSVSTRSVPNLFPRRALASGNVGRSALYNRSLSMPLSERQRRRCTRTTAGGSGKAADDHHTPSRNTPYPPLGLNLGLTVAFRTYQGLVQCAELDTQDPRFSLPLSLGLRLKILSPPSPVQAQA